MSTEARLFTVHGRVQGVWFRDSTRREAERLGITGHAINLPDGNVEVLACGTPDALGELEAWLRHGPPLARVSHVASKLPPTEVASKVPPTTFLVG
jgi:acylphosphatase